MSQSRPLHRRAHAKVNVGLAITGRRADGYHTLRSVFLRLALHDDLTVDLDPTTREDGLALAGADTHGLDTYDNLVLRAAARLRAHLGEPLPGLRFTLMKRIPVAAGLGGGSADAAAALDLALAAWGIRLEPVMLLMLALELGADVPFFAAGHAAGLVTGIGEKLQPLPAPDPPAGLLLLTPAARLGTTTVFAELDRLPAQGDRSAARIDALAATLRGSTDGPSLAAAGEALRDANDLWAPAVARVPWLEASRAAAETRLGKPLLLSGSGPTLFALYPSEADAARAAAQLWSDRPPELAGAAVNVTSTS